MRPVKKASAAPEHDVQAAAAAMTPVRAADGGDARRVARGGEPVVDGGANAAPCDRRIAGPVVPGDQQQDAVAGRDRALERPVDRPPCGVERQAVQVEQPVRLDRPAAQTLIPAAVEGAAAKLLPGT